MKKILERYALRYSWCCVPKTPKPIWFTSSLFLQFPAEFHFSHFCRHSLFFFCCFFILPRPNETCNRYARNDFPNRAQCTQSRRVAWSRRRCRCLRKRKNNEKCNLFGLCGARVDTHTHPHPPDVYSLFLIPYRSHWQWRRCSLYTHKRAYTVCSTTLLAYNATPVCTEATTITSATLNIFQFEIFVPAFAILPSSFTMQVKNIVCTEQRQCAQTHTHTSTDASCVH